MKLVSVTIIVWYKGFIKVVELEVPNILIKITSNNINLFYIINFRISFENLSHF